MTALQGVLAERDKWSAVGQCAIEKTMSLVGTKSAMLLMREAYYGTTRFDDFARRVGITKAATSARLTELVEAGLLTKQPYQEPGQRSRDEYVLTEAGTVTDDGVVLCLAPDDPTPRVGGRERIEGQRLAKRANDHGRSDILVLYHISPRSPRWGHWRRTRQWQKGFCHCLKHQG